MVKIDINKVNKNVIKLLKILNEHGYEAYVVGGACRDLLLNNIPSDYDVTTNCLPEKVIDIFSNKYKVFATGLKHGTVTVIINHTHVEVTTFRGDGVYLDNRHPLSVSFCNSLDEDLKRRDFTINAICFDISGNVYDYNNGLEDLNNKVIKCVGDPVKRFNEDALRMLRMIRFSTKLGFSISKDAFDAFYLLRNKLVNISIERIKEELVKTILIDKCGEGLLIFIDTFIEIGLIKDYKLDEDYIKNINNITNDLSIRLSYLMLKYDNIDKVKDALKVFKVSNDTIYEVLKITENINFNYFNNEENILLLLNKLDSIDLFSKLVELKKDLNNLSNEESLVIESCLEKVKNNELIYKISSLDIRGDDLIALGIKGKQIGKTLNFLFMEVLKKRVKNEKNKLIKYIIDSNINRK